MKKHFFEQYDYSDEKKKEIFSNCLFVFDTNVLLNLYRYTISTRDQMFEVMKAHKDRIWMPYQVGWEFFNNRKLVLESIIKFPDDLKDNFNSQKDKFINLIKGKKHPYISVDKVEKMYAEFCESFSKKIDEWAKKDPDYINNDVILNTLTELFEGNVGDDFDDAVLKKIYAEGKARYENKVPPGYCDYKEKKNESERRLYGDLIVWKQVIEAAKSKKMDVVLVTDDVKEDWFGPTKNGETKRARVELIKEFVTETGGQKVLLYTQNTFLHYIEAYLGTKIRKAAKEEVKEVSLYERTKQHNLWDIVPSLYDTLNDDHHYYNLFGTTYNILNDIQRPSSLEYLQKLYGSQGIIGESPDYFTLAQRSRLIDENNSINYLRGIYPERVSAIDADPSRYYHDYIEPVVRTAKSDGKEEDKTGT